MELRNWGFRVGLLKSVSFDVPIISVGNLAVGGTGKTPMVKYLIQQYQGSKTIGVLSRGYGRITKGFGVVQSDSLAKNVGDEPLEIKTLYPELTVTVCENRVLGIPEMLALNPNIDLVILDDAYQHQYVKPSVSIVLSTYSNPYEKDFVLPMGRLREFRKNINRADILIYTKSPDLNQENKNANCPTFNSQLHYQELINVFGEERKLERPLIVSGLADNAQLQQETQRNYPDAVLLGFNDHRNYSITEVKQLIYDADRLDNNVITTEKDWVKLKTFVLDLKPDVTFWVQPINLSFSEPSLLKKLIDQKIDA
jgi:tetraacyldisaccharide 4'-kinase